MKLESHSEDPRGQLLRNQRIIPVTHISELDEYVFLLQNDDVAKPRALNTFMEGLAELGINKNLIKNKKLLSDLLEKEKSTGMKRKSSTTEPMTVTRPTVMRRRLLRRGVELRNLTRAKMTLIATATNQQIAILKTRPLFSLKFPANIVRDLMFTKQRFCDAPNALGTIPT